MKACLTRLGIAVGVLALLPFHSYAQDSACARIQANSISTATIAAAAVIPSGPFAPDANTSIIVPTAACRVTLTLRPSSDSDIKVEVWLPQQGWNGKLQAVGNGGFNGSIAYPNLMAALSRGYAATSTDTGHVGNSAAFAIGHPEKLVDFGYRAVHEMTVAAKELVSVFYGSRARYTYWNGCSAGGRQGLQAAQRYPADFDGIIAGAPGLDWTGRASRAVQVAQAIERNPASKLTANERTLLHKAVVAACDRDDGLSDGLISQPERCTFDPAVLECKSAATASCLTAAQVNTARLMYSSATNTKTKRDVAGVRPGSELGWTDGGWSAAAQNTGVNTFRAVYQNGQWSLGDFNVDVDVTRAEDVDGNIMNALNPNLKPFIDRGGKLIQYHGLSDPQISPVASTQYYDSVVKALGTDVSQSYRLFLAPGMAHCGGGEGPNTFDMLSALEAWVERGTAPTQIVGSHETNGRVDLTRPLCSYPQVAKYKGTGSTNDAASFVCSAR